MHFADYLRQCVETVDDYSVHALQPGDFLVVDNAPIHHSDVDRTLSIWLNAQDIEVIFTPTYSPEFNPAEFALNKIKRKLERPSLSQLAYRNIGVAIYSAVEEVSALDVRGFFEATGYLFVLERCEHLQDQDDSSLLVILLILKTSNFESFIWAGSFRSLASCYVLSVKLIKSEYSKASLKLRSVRVGQTPGPYRIPGHIFISLAVSCKTFSSDGQ